MKKDGRATNGKRKLHLIKLAIDKDSENREEDKDAMSSFKDESIRVRIGRKIQSLAEQRFEDL